MIFRPFKNLQTLIKKTDITLRPHPDTTSSPACPAPTDPLLDKALFLTEMADVKPMSKNEQVQKEIAGPKPLKPLGCDDDDTLRRLNELVNHGHGFVVSQTPEYMEGSGPDIIPDVTSRLHSGEFAIQDYIDLHGMGLETAENAFGRFMKRAIRTGKHAVLIVHGRGLSSPAEPVLKTSVKNWLTRGKWRRWVTAFASARSCDGGAGATYVLLREQPRSKKCLA